MVDDVIAGIRARLDKVVVGNPRNETVTMGALVSLAPARRGPRRGPALGRADRDRVRRSDVGQSRGTPDPERGAFMSPVGTAGHPATVLNRTKIEAFGPVTTLIPYGAGADLGALAARGGGSLVGSIVSTIRTRSQVGGRCGAVSRPSAHLDRDCAGRIDRARHPHAATRPRRPWARRRRRGARWHSRRQALHATHRDAGVAGGDRCTGGDS